MAWACPCKDHDNAQRRPATADFCTARDDCDDEYRGRYGIDYLPRLYGPAHYSVIDDARELPQKIVAS